MNQTLNQEHIQKELKYLGFNWEIKDGSLFKLFEFESFNAAIEFVNKVAKIAEELQHHPDIYIYYKKVELKISTHSAGGLTMKDFELAEKLKDSTSSSAQD